MSMFDVFLSERKKNDIEYNTAVELKQFCYDNVLSCGVEGVELLELTPNPFSEDVYEAMNLRDGKKRKRRIELSDDEEAEVEEEEEEEDLTDDYSSLSSDNYTTTKNNKNKAIKKRKRSKRYQLKINDLYFVLFKCFYDEFEYIIDNNQTETSKNEKIQKWQF